MNPTGTIEVGVTRLPQAAGPVAGPAPVDGPPPGGRFQAEASFPGLDAAAFADADTFRALVSHWSIDEVYSAGDLLMDEGGRRAAVELVEFLRWLFLPSSDDTGPYPGDVPKEPQDAPVVKVEFVTDSPYVNGEVFWLTERVYLHHDNGHVSEEEVAPPEEQTGGDPFYIEWEEKFSRFEALFTRYTRGNPPNAGDHLIVELATGEFEQSGRYS